MNRALLWGAILVMALIICHQHAKLTRQSIRLADLQDVVDTYEDDPPAISCAGWRSHP